MEDKEALINGDAGTTDTELEDPTGDVRPSLSEDEREMDTDDALDDTRETDSNRDSEDEDKRLKLKKELSLFNAITISVGFIIGSGIFITPSYVLEYTGSFGLAHVALICWAVGGLIAIGGGLSYVELSLLLKNSGAEYSILKEAYSFRKKHFTEKILGELLAQQKILTKIFHDLA